MLLRALSIDLNSYFASVEQQLRPDLRGRPVAVAALDCDSTCCIAASYEAKRMGIRTGTPVGVARRQPGVTVVVARPSVYVRFHHAIRAAVDTCCPIDGVHSIDDLSCRLAPADQNPAAAAALARRIKQAIYDRVGECMSCSIGVAPNRVLAKLASDMQKPDGLVVLQPSDLPDALLGLDIGDLSGIGPRMKARLNRAGVWTMAHLYAQSERQLAAVWGGVVGQRWWYWLRGHDLPDPPTRRSSVGHSHVLPPALRTDDGARAVMVRLIHKAAVRLRAMDYWAGELSIYISHTFKEQGWSASVPLGPCQDTQTMIEAFAGLWPWRPQVGRPPTQVAVTLLNLEPAGSVTPPLFAALADDRRRRLSRVMDDLNRVWGTDTAYFAAMHAARDAAPTRISFGQVPTFTNGNRDAADRLIEQYLADLNRTPAAVVRLRPVPDVQVLGSGTSAIAC